MTKYKDNRGNVITEDLYDKLSYSEKSNFKRISDGFIESTIIGAVTGSGIIGGILGGNIIGGILGDALTDDDDSPFW